MSDYVYVNGWLLFVLLMFAGVGVERLFIDAIRAVARLKLRRQDHGQSADGEGSEPPPEIL